MAPPANNDWIPFSDIQGEEAADEYAKVANNESEVSVECHYTGKNKMTVNLGKSSDGHGYAYVEDSQSGKRLMTSRAADIQTLFQNWISFLYTSQSSVNPDPRSPDVFDMEPYLEDFVSALNDKFRINVQMDY
jgi:hypothetical protein